MDFFLYKYYNCILDSYFLSLGALFYQLFSVITIGIKDMYSHHTLLSPLNILKLNELLDPEAKIIIIKNIKIKKYQKKLL